MILSNLLPYLELKKTDDFNGEHQKGVGLYQFMNKKGKRSSSAYAFIESQLKNPLLNLLLETTVKEIIIENEVAIGVVIVNRFGEEEKIFANKEVILAAGSFMTPKILMLSGVGKEEELNEFSIKCKNNLPGVGKNLMDHPECPLIAKANGKYGYFKQGDGWRMLKNGIGVSSFWNR